MDVFIGFLYGICGSLLGCLAAHFLGKDREKRTAFNKAASSFRSAFTEEIRIIEKSTIETDFIELFNQAYARHYNAVIEFLPYLSESERTEIKEAWENHCYPKGLDGYERQLSSAKFLHYAHHQWVEMINGKPKILEEHEVSFERSKRLVKTNIDKILSFAKIK